MDGYEPETYGDRFADVYDRWYGDLTDVASCVDAVGQLAEEAGGGPVIELGVGTGRIALPLAERGLEVVGVDASEAMLGVLAAKPGAERITCIRADIAALDRLPVADAAVVLLTFNTFLNLVTEDDQLACLRAAHGWLRAGGTVVIEAVVPADDLAVGRHLEPSRVAVDEVVLTVSEVAEDGQLVSGQHVHLTEEGIRLRPWRLRLIGPDAIDELASRCGLTLRDRWAGWDMRPFGDDSTTHISVYAPMIEYGEGGRVG